MTEPENSEYSRISYFKLLNLEAVTPTNDTYKFVVDRNSILSSTESECLLDKNNTIKTGYENFCIKKGTTKLYPFKDFDFIGKRVVCQKCCQLFVSKNSYKAHVGTSICVRTCNGPNTVYLKYKNKNCRRISKKNKNKSVEKKNVHDIKKNLLNPEMLNTLQTRNNCYSDSVLQRKTEKQKNSSNKNDDPSAKKPRGRPRKNKDHNEDFDEVKRKKRGRPRKSNSMAVDSSSQNDNSSDNNPENNESELKQLSIELNCNVDNKYINETGKLQYFSSKMKILTDRFWKLIDTVWTQDKDTKVYQTHTERHDKMQCINEERKNADLSNREKEIFINIEILENDLKFLSKQCKDRSDYSYTEELELMLRKLNEKRNEYNQSKLKKTDMMNNGLTVGKGKENIQCIKGKNKEEYEKNENKIDFSIAETTEEWLTNDSSSTIPTISIKLNNDRTDVNNLNEESTNEVNLEENLGTLSQDVALNCMNSVKNHLNNFDFNHRYGSILACMICNRHFGSIVEWKMHHYEHLDMVKKKFLCKICGLKFKMYKNFVVHVNTHGQKDQNCAYEKKRSKLFKCKVCKREYNHLISYFAHIKTHK